MSTKTATSNTASAKSASTKAASTKSASAKSAATSTGQAEQAASETAEKIGAETRKAVEQGTEQARKGLETVAAFNQGNVEAVVASSKITAKALETVTAEMAAYSKKSLEDNMAAAKELGSCRDMAELVEKQAAFTRTALESFVAEASKLNEIYASAAREAFEPLGKRFTAAVEVVKDPRS